MKLIVNVDDVGIHPGVARAIEPLKQKGIVTSASIVANGPFVEEITTIDGLDLGIQLDILRGRPVGHWQNRMSLVDENGMFLNNPAALFKRYVLGKLEHEHVEKEWCDQIERALDLGIKPTHLSSTGHIHAWPTLTRMAGDLASRYGIRWIRKPEECSDISRLDKGGLQIKFLNVCGLFSRDTEGVSWTDLIWGIADHGSALNPQAFYDYMTKTCGVQGEVDVVEISCRPGVTEAGDPPIATEYEPTKVANVWRQEYQSLMLPDWFDVFAELDAELVGFGDMVPSDAE